MYLKNEFYKKGKVKLYNLTYTLRPDAEKLVKQAQYINYPLIGGISKKNTSKFMA